VVSLSKERAAPLAAVVMRLRAMEPGGAREGGREGGKGEWLSWKKKDIGLVCF